MEATGSETQAGFRRGRGASDHLFTLNQILSNASEFDTPTHTCFIDLRKAYDTVNRPALWRILTKSGLSGKLQRLIQELHSNSQSTVKAYGSISEPFSINNGVHQGCVLAPALFNLFLDHVVYQFIQILLYADDMAIVCSTPTGLNQLVTNLDKITQAWHLDISQKKTKILSIDRFNTHPKPSITLRNVNIENVDSFTYLGRNFSTHPNIQTEITARLQKAAHSFWRLKSILYSRPEISIKTKIRIFKTTAIPTLLYGSESWAPSITQTRRLETYQMHLNTLRNQLQKDIALLHQNNTWQKNIQKPHKMEEIYSFGATKPNIEPILSFAAVDSFTTISLVALKKTTPVARG